jgi:solute carrier family 25 (mitochondrial phosphate transporter), member 23/24/25/41
MHAMYCVIRKEGGSDLYHGLGTSCIKLMTTTSRSFMCYEAYKRILIEGEEDEEEIDDGDDEGKNTT